MYFIPRSHDIYKSMNNKLFIDSGNMCIKYENKLKRLNRSYASQKIARNHAQL